MSLSLNKIEYDLWLRLVELKYQSNIVQQIRTNQRNQFITLNEKFQRRVCYFDKFLSNKKRKEKHFF